MRRQQSLKIVALAALLQACGNTPVSTQAEEAVLTASSPEVIQQIKQAIVKLKGGIAPTLSSSVFQQRPTLLLEHGTSLQNDGIPILGAHDLAYESFVLQLRGSQCVLYYPKNQTYVPLNKVSCARFIP
ncbi:hypothetical protein [Pseudoalteromonas piscicida]|uniref:hypothetical protein n=1 Tax=Pseudoalteromonas piscicida TaxID=43662 RepID=UPI0030B6CA93